VGVCDLCEGILSFFWGVVNVDIKKGALAANTSAPWADVAVVPVRG